MNKKIRKVIEDLGWNINSDTSIEIWTDTSGQDVPIECNKKGELKETIRYRAENYDVNEEVGFFLEASNRGFQGVPDVVTLVDDCREVEEKLKELWFAVKDLPNF